MGVSGSGKTTLGRQLAQKSNAVFVDGDDLHPASNIAKMHAGQALTDKDRWPWLQKIVGVANTYLERGQTIVIACSALKLSYRDFLRHGIRPIIFLYLKADYATISARLASRTSHFMPSSLLQSQFAILEQPSPDEKNIYTLPAQNNPEESLLQAMSVLTGLGI